MKKRSLRNLLLTVFVMALVAAMPADAGTVTTINFDDLQDREFVTNQYSGLTFSGSNEILMFPNYNYGGYPPHSGTNVVDILDGYTRIDFNKLVSKVGVWYSTGNTDVYLEAYDSNGNLIQSNEGSFNYGSSNYLEVSGSNIAYVIIHDTEAWFTIDDFTYETCEEPLVIEAGENKIADEGQSVDFQGAFAASESFASESFGGHHGGHTYTYHWDFGDGSEEDSSLSTSHTYADNGIYTVTLTVTDETGNSASDTLTVTVNNVAPTVTSTGDVTFENGIATVSGTISDPSSTDTFELAINWGDGNTEKFLYPAGSTEFSEMHQYMDDSPSGTSSDDYNINVKVTDDDMGEGTTSTTVTVNNVAPEAGAINSPVDPIQVGAQVAVDSTFTDLGLLDTHTAVWEWGDGTTSDVSVTESSGSGTVIGTHTYSAAGIYEIKMTVTDDDSGSDYSVSNWVVVYDPQGGFVTGGGWINSPAGAYVPDNTLAGKATFGFVSKYQKGAKVPTGSTEFQFKVANLNFHSENYDWLVVTESKANYKGTGTINGEGNYGFMLSAVDGAIKGDNIDKFRIKIWDKESGNTIYDNEIGTEEDAEPSTAISGGSIVIHKEK